MENESTRERFNSLTYKDLISYINLSDGDKTCFDKLFNVLIFQGSINWSNQKLALVVGENESTLEKRLKRLEKAQLIIRDANKIRDEFGRWHTVDRVIKLNPVNFQFDFDTMAHRIYTDWLFHMQTGEILDRYLEMPFNEFMKVYGNIKVVNV